MNTDTILRLLKNSGFNVLGSDSQFIILEDPSCILRSFEAFINYTWIAISFIAGLLLFGWAISMIRGAKTDIATNIRNLFLIFGILAAVKPIVNLIYGDDIFARGCKTIKVSIADIQKILDTRNAKLKKYNENDLYEEFDIYDSGAADLAMAAMSPNDAPYAALPAAGGGNIEPIPVSVSGGTGIASGAHRNDNMSAPAQMAGASNNEVIYTNHDGTRYKRSGGTRAWRNKNPGNMRYTDFTRRMGAIGSAGGFAVFPDEYTGANAIKELLKSKSYNTLTVGGAISRYAPPSENDTAAYHRRMEQLTGMSVNTRMNTLSDTQLQSVVNAIMQVEGWKPGTEQRI